ncbi:MAG TPA: TetR-like C-terminal domain-containing protein [Mycobacterium sp.]|nr:TetR-like C-terminal domain-containing protein [Mycobacterium sp.]
MGIRQDTRDRIEAQIIELGRRQLITEGAAGLSLRAIARDLGMVSSAVYRYVASRDDLLTLLLVDAYNDLADAVERAHEHARGDGAAWHVQVLEMARAARRWAVAGPASWALLYGSPVPGYRAPAEVTVQPGTRVIAALLQVIGQAAADGLIADSEVVVPQSVSDDFDRLRAEFAVDCSDTALTKCFTVWAALVGAISLEVFGQYGADTLTDASAMFDLQIEAVLSLLTV